MKRKLYLQLLLLAVPFFIHYNCHAQKRNDPQILKISEDDDFFNFRGEGTDRGYTSGLKIELYYTKNVKPRFPSTLLMNLGGKADNLYGWGISQNMYTPDKLDRPQIQYGDRPYCGTTYFTHTLISSDKEKKQKLTTSFSLGVIGKYSYAGDVQSWVHNLIHYQKAQGWDNQIQTDVIVNYSILYEHLLFNPTPNLDIIGNIQGNAGTLYNNIGFGIQFRAGLFNDYFTNYERPTYRAGVADGSFKKFRFLFIMKTQVAAVMDDATLQGGFFSHDASPYKISKDSINRVYMQYEYGVMIANKRLGLSVTEKLRTPEFKGYFTQQTGNVTLYIGL